MRLITFPGQGTSISIPVLKALIRNKTKEFDKILEINGPKTFDLLNYIFKNPSSPGSIAVCSNLFYQLYSIINNQNNGAQHNQNKTKSNISTISSSLSSSLASPSSINNTNTNNLNTFLLGHSLGELTCLSINELFPLNDLFNIANYRNELMVKYTEKYLLAHKLNHSSRFEMWAFSSPKATNLPLQVHTLLQSLRSTAPTIAIANVNSIKQCVVTGLIEDLEKLRIESQTRFPSLRITELTNPNNIAFHNNNVLRSIQEPLYDYIWDVLKLNQKNTTTELDYPIIGNLDGRISYMVHHAIERFVRCSSNTVQFTFCYDTINNMIENQSIENNDSDISNSINDSKTKSNNSSAFDDISVCMGPGSVIYNLIRRNCNLKTFEYSSLATINEYHNLIHK